LSALLVGASSVTAINCIESIAHGVNSVAKAVEGLSNDNLMEALVESYTHMQKIEKYASECRDMGIAMGPGPILLPRPPKIAQQKPVSMTISGGKCPKCIENVVADSMKTSEALETAIRSHSVNGVVDALKDARELEWAIVECQHYDCTLDEVERTPCVKTMNDGVHRIISIGNVLKSLIHGNGSAIEHLFIIKHDIMTIPKLAKKLAANCASEIKDTSLLGSVKEVFVHDRRRSLFDLMDKVLNKTSETVAGDEDKLTSVHDCFGQATKVLDHFGGIKNALMHMGSISDILDGFGHVPAAVSNTMLVCHKAQYIMK